MTDTTPTRRTFLSSLGALSAASPMPRSAWTAAPTVLHSTFPARVPLKNVDAGQSRFQPRTSRRIDHQIGHHRHLHQADVDVGDGLKCCGRLAEEEAGEDPEHEAQNDSA